MAQLIIASASPQNSLSTSSVVDVLETSTSATTTSTSDRADAASKVTLVAKSALQEYFSPDSFFSLDTFTHRAVFQRNTYVWEALGRLQGYLEDTCSEIVKTHSQEKRHCINSGVVLLAKDAKLANMVSIDGLCIIGEGTIVEDQVCIKGPCIIGKNCQIRHAAYIRDGALVGDNCVVGHCTEVSHSILLNTAKAAHFAYIGDSIIGNDVNFGAGVRCANLRLDRAKVSVKYNEQSIPTGMPKMGAIVGDGCQIGCNVVMNPGTIVGKKSKCFPLINFGGVIEAASLVKTGLRPHPV